MTDEDRYTRITLRIPKELWGKIAAAAEETSKSKNAEIIGRLEQSFSKPLTSEEVNEKVNEFMGLFAAELGKNIAQTFPESAAEFVEQYKEEKK